MAVIVTDLGGAAGLMHDGVSGMVVRGHDGRVLQSAMLRLMDGSLRIEMGRAARAYAEVNRVDEPFTAVLDSEAYRRQLRKKKRAAARPGAGASSADGAAVKISSPVAANEPLAVTAADARAMAIAGEHA